MLQAISVAFCSRQNREFAMKKNEAGWDRMVRLMLGLIGLSLVAVGPQTLWGLLGLIPLATGATGFCPLYAVFGISTCAVEK